MNDILKILVFGYQNPDTDAVGTTTMSSHLQNELGKETEIVTLGTPNKETQYALDHFQLSAPRVVESAKAESADVALMDHNEFQQNTSDISEVSILVVVDHHRIADLETVNPLYRCAEPVGCTSTTILRLYKENRATIPREIAGIMLSAIASDTLLFKLPTRAPEDKVATKELAAIAEVNLNIYGLEMLKAGTNLSDKPAAVPLDLDAKSLPMSSSDARITQVSTVDLSEMMNRQTELEVAMEDEMKTDGHDLFVLVVTNILSNDSELLVVGKGEGKVEEVFQATLANNCALFKGVVSRKK